MFILFTMNIVPVHGNIREWVYESNYSFFPKIDYMDIKWCL